jgi:mono/diheme cytochrome c family protein
MLGSLQSLKKKNLGAPLQSRKAMLETLFRHLDMVRLSAGAILPILVVALVGCTGLIDGGSDGLSTQQRNALAKWQNEAFPVLRDNCATCHNGSRVGVGFLVGATQDDIHDQLVAYEPAVVNLEAPKSSRILSKGLHDGPELTPDQSSSILQWLQAEQEATQHDPTHPVQLLAIPAFAVQLCTAGLPDNAAGTCPTNHAPLSTLGDAAAAIPGAEITFTAQALTSLYITNLKFSGGTAGAYIEHPLFVSRPAMGDPIPDQIDRFFNLKLNEAANATEQMSGGTHSFAGFAPTDMLEIHFKVVSAFKPDTSGGGTIGTGGCKVLASFKANAAGQLQANCASCHAGGNAGAKAAMDLTGVNATDDPTAQIACNQVRTRINLTTTDQSGFYLAPDPASATNHPFKFPAGQFTTFKTPVDIWVQAEKTAP